MSKSIFVAFSALFLTLVFYQNTHAADILFESREVTQLARGVHHIDSRMMTTRGLVDVHALIIDITDPFVTVAPVMAYNAIGRRETTTRLLRNAGAIAGVNADFFGMAHDHSVHFGIMARSGELIAVNPGTNAPTERERFATFLLDMAGNPFFTYLRGDVRLVVNGWNNIQIASYNTLGSEMWGPVIVDRFTMQDTSSVNERFDNLVTVIVEGSIVTGITAPGEVAAVPENGFLVIFPMDSYLAHRGSIRQGDHVAKHLSTNLRVDFSRIEAAIGGGAVIMRNGLPVSDIYGVFPAGRHPRTAIGQTADRRLVLLTVDGRTHSVGANHSELVGILRHFGVVNAIALDGGGSTTFVTRSPGGGMAPRNTVSDGSERAVVNALGVFVVPSTHQPISLGIEPITTRAIVNVPLEFSVAFEDAFHNEVAYTPSDGFTYITESADGFLHYGRYVPIRAGTHTIEVHYGHLRGSLIIQAYDLGEIRPSRNQVVVDFGESAELGFTGITTSGHSVNLPYIGGLTVTPSHLGHFDGMTFYGTGYGIGYITARIGSVATHFAVFVGGATGVVELPESTVNQDLLWARQGIDVLAGGDRYSFFVPARGSNPFYSVNTWSSFAIVTLPTIGGSIQSEYWSRFMNDIRETDARDIVVMMEISPAGFGRRQEFELFHRAMTELANAGKRVFVVTPGTNTSSNVRDNVRYIELSGAAIRFWTSGEHIFWSEG